MVGIQYRNAVRGRRRRTTTTRANVPRPTYSPKVGDVDTDVVPQSSYLESFRQTIEQVDVIHSLCRRYPETFGFADSSSSVWSAFRSGRIASLIGVEGLHQTANSLSALRMLHRLGVRYVTLSHNCNNEHADAAVRDDPCCPCPLAGGKADVSAV